MKSSFSSNKPIGTASSGCWSVLRQEVDGLLELLIADPCILIGAILSIDLHFLALLQSLFLPLLPLFARYFAIAP
jgi:hypothetical protein